MLNLSSRDVRDTLLRCYQVMAGVVPAKSGDSFSGGSGQSGRLLSRQVDMALASKVIGLVDRLPEEAANYYRWVYGSVDDSKACYFLMRYCWAELLPALVGRRDNVRDAMSMLRMVAPLEIRHRASGAGGVLYSHAALAEMVGVHESRFRQTYAGLWRSLVLAGLDIGLQFDEVLGDKIGFVVSGGDVFRESVMVSCLPAAARPGVGVRCNTFVQGGRGASSVVDDEVTDDDVQAYLARSGCPENKLKKVS